MQQLSPLILGSGSPRRREILGQLGLQFEVITSGVEEPAYGGRDPAGYARGLAEAKAREVAAGSGLPQGAWVLGADTIVVVDRDVLGKPVDESDAVQMLLRMAGREHEVITAVAAVPSAAAADARVIHVRTAVRFREFDRETAARYAATGEGRDKAGSYALQGVGGGLVRGIEGSHSNVIGLPAAETLELLETVGVLRGWP